MRSDRPWTHGASWSRSNCALASGYTGTRTLGMRLPCRQRRRKPSVGAAPLPGPRAPTLLKLGRASPSWAPWPLSWRPAQVSSLQERLWAAAEHWSWYTPNPGGPRGPATSWRSPVPRQHGDRLAWGTSPGASDASRAGRGRGTAAPASGPALTRRTAGLHTGVVGPTGHYGAGRRGVHERTKVTLGTEGEGAF